MDINISIDSGLGLILPIFNNNFQECENAIKYDRECSGLIKYNLFTGNSINIFLRYRCFSVIQQNNLSNYIVWNIKARQYNTNLITNAENNWWGTIYLEEINESIEDANNIGASENWGIVDYEPFEIDIIDDCGVRL